MAKNKALFLDRDGVINIDKGYVYKVEDFVFMDNIFDVSKYYHNKGYLIIIVTNQSGIARGYYTEEDFMILTEWMIGEFSKRHISITNVYHCPHHPDFGGPCDCRKPRPGMLLSAANDYDIDLSESILIGDSSRDIEAGQNAGILRNLFITENLFIGEK